jgi:hypothetical protein
MDIKRCPYVFFGLFAYGPKTISQAQLGGKDFAHAVGFGGAGPTDLSAFGQSEGQRRAGNRPTAR